MANLIHRGEFEPLHAGGCLVLRGRRSRLLITAALFGAAHCADPVDAPPAFSGERYLCGPEHAAEFEALVEDCRTLRQTSVCGGVLSLRGNIDSEDVTLDGHLGSVEFSSVAGVDPSVSGGLVLRAPAPYFDLTLNLRYLAVPPLTSLSGLLPASCATSPSDATETCLIVNLEARGGNYLSSTVNVYRTVELETASERRMSFTGDLVRGGSVDGCFHAFVTAPQ
jgi:hypothetical protein